MSADVKAYCNNFFWILVEVSNTTEASEPYWVYNFQGNKGGKETKLVANTYSFDDFYQVWRIQRKKFVPELSEIFRKSDPY